MRYNCQYCNAIFNLIDQGQAGKPLVCPCCTHPEGLEEIGIIETLEDKLTRLENRLNSYITYDQASREAMGLI